MVSWWRRLMEFWTWWGAIMDLRAEAEYRKKHGW